MRREGYSWRVNELSLNDGVRMMLSWALVYTKAFQFLVNVSVRFLSTLPLPFVLFDLFVPRCCMDRLGGLGISLNVEGEPSFSFKTFGHTHPQGCGGWCPAPRMGRRCPEYYCEVGDALAM